MKDPGPMRVQRHRPRLTSTIPLDGKQDRLRQLTLYVSERCAAAQWMGLTKLNKILWKADFDSYAARRIPVTGRAYHRLELGPAPKEMKPLLDDMLRSEALRMELTDFGDGVVERRPIAQVHPKLDYFSADDMKFVDAAISYYWEKTGKETSDDSHGVAWKSRENGDPMFYELAYLSDAEVSPRQRIGVLQRVAKRAAGRRRSR